MSIFNLQQELFQLILSDDERFDFIREATPSGLWIRDLNNPSDTWMDPLFWKALGYEAHEIPVSMEDWLKVVQKEDIEFAQMKLLKHIENPENSYEQVLPYKKKNGESAWIYCKGIVTYNEDGLPSRLLGSHEFVEKMREKEEMLSLCNKQAKIGYWQYDVQNDKLDISLEFKRLVGISQSVEVNIPNILDFFHKEDQPLALAHLDRTLKHLDKIELELRFYKNGNIHWGRAIGSPIVENGILTKLVGTFQDIQEQKLKEIAVIESQIQYKNLVDLISDIVIQFNNDGIISYISNRWKNVLGYNIHESLNTSVFDYLHPEDYSTIKNSVQSFNQVKERVLIFRLITATNEIKWFRGGGRAIEDASGRRIGFQVVLGDLTEFVHIQQQLDEKTEQIKNILDEASEVIWSVKVPENEMIYINPAIEDLYELSVEQCMNDPYYWTKHIHPADKYKIQFIIDTVNSKGEFSEKFRLLMPDGRIKWVENRGKMIYKDGVAIRAHGILVDRTKQVETELLLNEEIRLQQLLLKLSSTYINCSLENLDETINQSLSEIGQFVDADRVYIFEYDFEQRIGINTYEWCELGITAEIDNLKAVPFELMPEWLETHRNNQPAYVPDVDSLEDFEFKNHLQEQGIKSLISIPMSANGQLIGFVGFDQVRNKRTFGKREIDLLFLFAQMLINVFERRDRVNQLQKQEEKYRNIISNMRLGILEVDTKDNILFANQSFLDMCGYEMNELEGKDATVVFLGENNKSKMDKKLKDREQGLADIYELEIKHKNGDKRNWLISAAPNYNDKGQYIGSIGIHLDISEQKRLEKEIAYSESLFRTLFDKAPVGIALKDYHTGQFLTINEHFLKITGYKRDEIINQHYSSLTPEYFWHLDEDAENELKIKGYFSRYRKSFMTKRGDEIPVEVKGTIINDLDNQKRVWTFIEDISQRLKLEKAISDESRIRKQIAEDFIQLKENFQEQIYRELHDGVNQLLFASKLNLENSEIRHELVDNAIDLLEKGIQEIRKIALESTSQFVEERGFAQAVTEYLLRLNTLGRMRFIVDDQLDEDLTIPVNIQKNLFRICQELAQNALKHSQAQDMSFRIKMDGRDLLLIAKDNGVGFKDGNLPGVGMKSISNRIYLIGGRIRYLNFPGKGFGVCIQVQI